MDNIVRVVGKFFQSLGFLEKVNWTAISSLATVASVIIVTIAASLTYGQVKEAVQARQLQGALAILDIIDTPERRLIRRFIFVHGKAVGQEMKRLQTQNISLDQAVKKLDTFMQTKDSAVSYDLLQSYLGSLESMAILVMHDLAPDSIIETYFGHLLLDEWTDLFPFVAALRSWYDSNNYLQHTEMLKEMLEHDKLYVPHMHSRRWFLRSRRHKRAISSAAKQGKLRAAYEARRKQRQLSGPLPASRPRKSGR